MNENDVKNKIPNQEFINHHEFELEVLAANQIKGVKLFKLKQFFTLCICYIYNSSDVNIFFCSEFPVAKSHINTIFNCST